MNKHPATVTLTATVAVNKLQVTAEATAAEATAMASVTFAASVASVKLTLIPALPILKRSTEVHYSKAAVIPFPPRPCSRHQVIPFTPPTTIFIIPNDCRKHHR